MKHAYADVLAFNTAFKCAVGSTPAIPDDDARKLCMKLIDEEYGELMAGLATNDMVEIADGAIDLIYVVLYMCVVYGIDPAPLWNEVQRANMAKLGGGRSATGKILKPEGWQPPDIAGLLHAQGWRDAR